VSGRNSSLVSGSSTLLFNGGGGGFKKLEVQPKASEFLLEIPDTLVSTSCTTPLSKKESISFIWITDFSRNPSVSKTPETIFSSDPDGQGLFLRVYDTGPPLNNSQTGSGISSRNRVFDPVVREL
jgi:hypothetical protein